MYLKPSLVKIAAFKSFSEAHEALLELYLQHFEIVTMDKAALIAYRHKLQDWQGSFVELIASRERASALSTVERQTIALLELQKQDIALNINVVEAGSGVYGRNLLKWDKYTKEFNEMVDNATIALGLDDCGSLSAQPQFHLHFGVISILKSVIGRCRDPYIRRRAIGLLAAKPVQEGMFSSDLTVKIARRIVELEEGGRAIASCNAIPEDARLLFSSLHLDSGHPRVMVRFTFKYGTREETIETGESP